jgi:hypothetical protein
MAETTPDQGQKTSFSRRDFLKVAGLAAGTLALTQTEIGRKTTSLLTGPNTEWISSEIPPELLGKEIPTKNEFYRQPLVILSEGISLYEDWKKSDSNLFKISYNKPPNYIDTQRMASLLTKGTPDRWFLDGLIGNDQPDNNTIEFSMGGVRSFDYIVVANPGTGLIRQVKDGYKQKTQRDFDLSTDDQEQFLKNNCLKWFDDAKKFVNKEVDKKGKQSTSLLFAYFLHKNKGNLNESMWDTTLWLKVAGRNDLQTWEQKPTRQGAELLTSMFKDEFSLNISANWVLENIPTDSSVLNSPEKYVNMQYKDFMPVNRAGSFYHPWNIMALSTSASSMILERFVHAQYSYLTETQYHGKNSLVPDGREKVKADLEVSKYADDIDRLVQGYKKEN